jgi:ATP-binding cassette, subfamily C, bacterial LapB
VVASLGVNLLSMAIPITLMQVYDRIVPADAVSTLIWLVVLCVVALLLEGSLRFMRSVVGAWMAARFEHIVGTKAVDKILRSRLGEFRKHSLGAHIDRLNAVGMLRTFYAGQVFQVLLDIPFVFVFLFAVFFLSPKLIIVTISVSVLFLACIAVVKKRFKKVRELQEVQNDRRFDFILEVLGGIHFLKAQAFEEEMMRRYERLQASSAHANMESSGWSAFPSIIGMTFSQINMFGVVGFGAVLVIEGKLTLGGLAACTLLASRAFQPIQNMASFLLRFSQAEIARSHIEQISAMPGDTLADTPTLPREIVGRVEFADVTFGHAEGDAPLFENLNISIPPRGMIGIFGTNSAGTSTFLQLVAGLLQPGSGKITIDDFDLKQWDCSNRRGSVEYVPRIGSLFKGTILDNISMFDPNKATAAFIAAELLDLDDLVASLPNGYETVVDSQAKNFLPPGLVQRICIARALVDRPRVLLFDKCGEVMDRESQRVFRQVLARLKGRCTVIVVSSNAKFLMLADSVYRLSRGKLVERDFRSRVS